MTQIRLPLPTPDPYLDIQAEARRMYKLGWNTESYLWGRVAADEITQADAMVIWRGLSGQWTTPFDEEVHG